MRLRIALAMALLGVCIALGLIVLGLYCFARFIAGKRPVMPPFLE